MPASFRRDVDVCTGHGCFSPRNADVGSPNVNANTFAVVRVGDHFVTHCCGPVCHDSACAAGSPNVHANGIPKMRIGDAVACGGAASTGSSNYFINGG